MSEIKTAEQRIHKLEGGEGDSFVTFEQALIAERDELRKALTDRDASLDAARRLLGVETRDSIDNQKLRAENIDLKCRLTALEGAYIPTYLERLAASPATLEAEFTALRSEALDLRAALAERDAKLAALEAIANSDDGAGGEGMKLFLENREMKARLAALEKQEPVAEVGSVYALYWCGSEPLETLLKRHPSVKAGSKLYAAAGVAPVPKGWQLVPVEPTQEMCEVTTWDFNRFYAPHEIYKTMLEAAPKEPTCSAQNL